MLRRPISTVLSSLSIGSRLSTRLFCAFAASTTDQIPTVRTRSRWVDGGTERTINGIYWGRGDMRNMKVENGNDPMDKQGTQIRSRLMALEQAQKDGLKQIRVQTDSAMNELYIRKMVSKYKNNSARKEPHLSKFKYCERILKIMDEMEVILEYRKPWFENKGGNEVLALLNEKRKNCGDSDDSSIDSVISPNACHVDGNTVPTGYSGSTVRTTGYGWEKYGYRFTFHGIFWGQGDPRNTMEQRRDNTTDTKGIMLRSIMIALEQAMKSGLKQIRVQTDSDMTEIYIRKLADMFNNEDLMTKANVHLAQLGYSDKIVKIMDEIKVILEYVSPWNELSRNEVHELLQKEKRGVSQSSTVDIIPVGVPSMEDRTVPTVYVSGIERRGIGAIVSLWNPASIEHLEINQRPLGSIQRLAVDYSTHIRFQMLAVLIAIKEAQSLHLCEIRVITHSLPFVGNFSRDWKDSKGNIMVNKDLYLEIKALTETIKVHFKGAMLTQATEDELLRKVEEMAKEGLRLPVENVKNLKE